MNEISPREHFEHTLARWWVIAIFAILGGMAGWAASLLTQPVYETSAEYSVLLDEVKAQQILAASSLTPQNLDFTIKNFYLAPVEKVFYDDDTATELLEKASKHGIALKKADFNKHNFYLSRFAEQWFVVVRHNDPDSAAFLANTWLEIAHNKLTEAQSHATAVAVLNKQIELVSGCFEAQPLAQANQCAGTDYPSVQEAGKALIALKREAESVKLASRNISTLITFRIVSRALPPPSPILFTKSTMMLAGMGLGLLLGLGLAQGNIKLPRKSKTA